MARVEIIESSSVSEQMPELKDEVQLSVTSLFYTWTLNDFSKSYEFAEARIHSPEFTFKNSNWRLLLQIVSKNDELDEIKIRLLKSDKAGSEFYIKYKFSLLNADGSVITKEGSSSFLGESNWGKKLSFKCDSVPSFVVHDTLTIICQLSVLSSVELNESPSLSVKSTDPVDELIKSKHFIRKPPYLFNRRGTRRMPINTLLHHDIEYKLLRMFFFLVTFYLFCMLVSDITNVYEKSGVNMTKVNDLIVDSTLKIMNIAEVLNLTSVKIKSSELLALYGKHYNIANKNFSNVSFNYSHPTVSDDKLKKASD